MNMEFRMTADEFFLGWKYRKKKSGAGSKLITAMIMMLCVAMFVIGIATQRYYFSAAPVCVVIFMLFMAIGMEKKSVKNEYNTSAILNTSNTLFVEEEGIRIISSFEKMFVPYGSIFAAEDKGDYFYLLPTFRKGIFVINKSRYAGEELDNIISTIKEKIS